MKTVHFLDRTFSLEMSDPGSIEPNACGRAQASTGIIWVNSTMTPEAIASTLIHEVIHLIAYLQGVDLKEEQITALETGIFSFIRSNKELIDRLIYKKIIEIQGNKEPVTTFKDASI